MRSVQNHIQRSRNLIISLSVRLKIFICLKDDVANIGQPRAAASSVPTVIGGLPGVQTVPAGTLTAAGSTTPMSTIRLTMPAATAQARQRSPATVATSPAASQVPHVLKVMGTQPGSIPQIITLSSPRAVSHNSTLELLLCRFCAN
jgi:hypothetical protein